jgi:hypothetical protein
MLIKNNLFIIYIITFIIFPKATLLASNKDTLSCQGIYWSHKEAQYAEWKIIKRVSVHKIYFKINNIKKSAKVSFRKGNGGIIIGMGGWENKTEEKSSLSFSYSLTKNIFKMKSRYSDTKIEGKCEGKINL